MCLLPGSNVVAVLDIFHFFAPALWLLFEFKFECECEYECEFKGDFAVFRHHTVCIHAGVQE